MTALYVAPRVPLVDQNGICNPIWYRLFEQLFSTAGAGGVANTAAFEVAPSGEADAALWTALQAIGDDVAPVPQSFTVVSDDVSPLWQVPAVPDDNLAPDYSALRAEIAALRAEIDDLRKGTLA